MKKSFFNVSVEDNNKREIFSFFVNAKDSQEASKIAKNVQSDAYEHASDVGHVNLFSNFTDKSWSFNTTETQQVKFKSKQAVVIIGSKEFRIKKNELLVELK